MLVCEFFFHSQTKIFVEELSEMCSSKCMRSSLLPRRALNSWTDFKKVGAIGFALIQNVFCRLYDKARNAIWWALIMCTRGSKILITYCPISVFQLPVLLDSSWSRMHPKLLDFMGNSIWRKLDVMIWNLGFQILFNAWFQQIGYRWIASSEGKVNSFRTRQDEGMLISNHISIFFHKKIQAFKEIVKRISTALIER